MPCHQGRPGNSCPGPSARPRLNSPRTEGPRVRASLCAWMPNIWAASPAEQNASLRALLHAPEFPAPLPREHPLSLLPRRIRGAGVRLCLPNPEARALQVPAPAGLGAAARPSAPVRTHRGGCADSLPEFRDGESPGWGASRALAAGTPSSGARSLASGPPSSALCLGKVSELSGIVGTAGGAGTRERGGGQKRGAAAGTPSLGVSLVGGRGGAARLSPCPSPWPARAGIPGRATTRRVPPKTRRPPLASSAQFPPLGVPSAPRFSPPQSPAWRSWRSWRPASSRERERLGGDTGSRRRRRRPGGS